MLRRPLARAVVALSLALALGCAYLATLTNDTAPGGLFRTAKIIYADELEAATGQIELCSQGGTSWNTDCAAYASKLRDVATNAASVIQLGDLLVAGLVPIECDEVGQPGCTEVERLQQLQLVIFRLQQLTARLGSN